jgi:uncharacterized membrane protein YdbT with pleckstrin-like domain
MADYIDRSLAESEEVVMRGRWPVIYWIGAWVMIVAFAWALIGGLVSFGIGAIIGFGALFLCGLLWFTIVALHMMTTDFAVTNQRVVLKRGWLTLSTQELAVANIEEVRIEQTIFGRLFGFGRVIVTGTGEGVILFPPLAHPIDFRRAIENARTRARQTSGVATPPEPEDDPKAKKKR